MISYKEKYQTEVIPELQKQFEYANVMQLPKLQKIVLNSAVSNKQERDVLTETQKTLTTITGQKAVITKARKSVAQFKLREGQAIGSKVTLRGQQMYDFLGRLIDIALPRVRDFRGIPKRGFDGQGNYNMGLDDQSIFTEIDLDKAKYTLGMDVAFVTSANTDEECRVLLETLGMPFEK